MKRHIDFEGGADLTVLLPPRHPFWTMFTAAEIARMFCVKYIVKQGLIPVSQCATYTTTQGGYHANPN